MIIAKIYGCYGVISTLENAPYVVGDHPCETPLRSLTFGGVKGCVKCRKWAGIHRSDKATT